MTPFFGYFAAGSMRRIFITKFITNKNEKIRMKVRIKNMLIFIGKAFRVNN